MKDRYLSLGGNIEDRCEAVDIDIEGNRVLQVKCSNDKVFKANYFIAACDANVLYERLLKGKYNDLRFQERYNNSKDYPLASEVRISVGFDGTMADLPRTLRFPLATPFRLHETTIDRLQMTNYDYEPGFSPEGKTILSYSINQFRSDYDAWDTLSKDNEAYRREKARIGQEVIRATEERFPQMKGKLELLDVCTPKTFERYCNAYRGSFMAFLPTINSKLMDHSGKIKGLKNIFLSGQWLQPPGGLPIAVITGKDTIMRICKKERKPFASSN